MNRPLLNEKKFIKTPSYLVKTVGERMYKTGDRGYLLSDGSLEVIGRCDSMVKIRGYTIELKVIASSYIRQCVQRIKFKYFLKLYDIN